MHFAGEDITGLAPREIARKGISRSFQIMNLFNDYSALDNVLVATPHVREQGFNAWRDLGADSAAQDQAAAVLARVGLAGKEQVPASSLSYGERRALEIGVALAAEPRMLFLDEPTAGLGAEGTARLAELVGELKRQLTIVIIEHDMQFLFGLADRVSVIHWGQVIAQGTPAELRRTNGCAAPTWGSLGMNARRDSRPPRRRSGAVRRCSPCERASTPSTARRRCCSTCRSRWRPAKWWRCSAPTAPARRPRCARSWA